MLCNGGLGSFFVGKLGNERFVFSYCGILVNDAQQFLAGNLTVDVKLLNEFQCSEHGIAAGLIFHSVRLLYPLLTLKLSHLAYKDNPGEGQQIIFPCPESKTERHFLIHKLYANHAYRKSYGNTAFREEVR